MLSQGVCDRAALVINKFSLSQKRGGGQVCEDQHYRISLVALLNSVQVLSLSIYIYINTDR